ncbi:short chain dehydrogenase [Aureococcus anophagefferens]|nr:short chain dehydrogenase [Aureococcus anophagefferens]
MGKRGKELKKRKRLLEEAEEADGSDSDGAVDVFGGIPVEDVEATCRTLEALGKDLTLFRSRPFKRLRAALAPAAVALVGGGDDAAPFTTLHAFYANLCPACAALNWGKRDERCDLAGRGALVTGARVKIGFRVALKLLRCGARVVATTRPADCASRFNGERDADEWRDRLVVVGCDFRDLRAVEALCAAVPAMVDSLDILVNNACQTVRRPPQYYATTVSRELKLRRLLGARRTPRALHAAIRGGPPAAVVSAMEGKFYRHKQPTHPHTNMAKAALNMMTRTAAADLAKAHVYMTAVDTGWINDEKPTALAVDHAKAHDFQTPLDEVDAAARILDPAIAPLRRLEAGDPLDAPYGVFLKDYAVCEW